jgi:hypothetical protein
MDDNVMGILRAIQTQMRQQETHIRDMEQRLIRQEREDSPIRISPRDSDRFPATNSNNRDNRANDVSVDMDDEAAYAEHFCCKPKQNTNRESRNSKINNRRTSFYTRDKRDSEMITEDRRIPILQLEHNLSIQ